jgi:hypothetical protein
MPLGMRLSPLAFDSKRRAIVFLSAPGANFGQSGPAFALIGPAHSLLHASWQGRAAISVDNAKPRVTILICLNLSGAAGPNGQTEAFCDRGQWGSFAFWTLSWASPLEALRRSSRRPPHKIRAAPSRSPVRQSIATVASTTPPGAFATATRLSGAIAHAAWRFTNASRRTDAISTRRSAEGFDPGVVAGITVGGILDYRTERAIRYTAAPLLE